jgi:hypothetical protein
MQLEHDSVWQRDASWNPDVVCHLEGVLKNGEKKELAVFGAGYSSFTEEPYVYDFELKLRGKFACWPLELIRRTQEDLLSSTEPGKDDEFLFWTRLRRLCEVLLRNPQCPDLFMLHFENLEGIDDVLVQLEDEIDDRPFVELELSKYLLRELQNLVCRFVYALPLADIQLSYVVEL